MLNKEDIELLEKMFTNSENLILKEIDRTREILEKQLRQVQANMNELEKYHKTTKLENDNINILLRVIDDLSKRVTELEHKIA